MSLFNKLTEAIQVELNELTYNGFKTKQKSITKLFPKFPERKKAIYANGGVRLSEQFPELWWFKVASGTKQGTSYDVYLRFKNILPTLQQFVANKQLWVKAGNTVNYNLLAPEVLNVIDFEMDCSCPADLYWGPEYQKTQYKNTPGGTAQFGDQEDRAPQVRNPRQYGLVCKHQDDVLERLPFYTGDFAKFLKTFYDAQIQKMVQEILNKEEDTNATEVEGGA